MELSLYILVIFITLSFGGTDCVVYGMPVITYTSKILSEFNGITYIITLVSFFSQMTVNPNLRFSLTLCSSTSSTIFRIVGCIGPEG